VVVVGPASVAPAIEHQPGVTNYRGGRVVREVPLPDEECLT